MNNEFVLIGASGHAKVIIEIIEEMKAKVKAIVDTNPQITTLLEYNVTTEPVYYAPVIVAIGNNALKKK